MSIFGQVVSIMAERSILEELWEAWRLFGMWLRLKWILFFSRLPRENYRWITIEPERIRIKSFQPDRVDAVSELNGTEPPSLYSQWDGEAYFGFVGMKSPFSMSASDSRPSDAQIEFLRTLLRRKQSFRHALAVEMFNHYQEFVYKNMDFCVRKDGNVSYVPAPAVESPAALDKSVYAASIYFSDDDAKEGRFDIEVNCELDVGCQDFTLTVKDWQVVAVR